MNLPSGSLPVVTLLEMAAPYNPRRIDEPALEKLQRSIREFGFVEPVVVNSRTSRIVGGHQRVRAAELEGYQDLPVVFVDLDETAERQLNLALNKLTGEWDDDKLRDLLGQLQLEHADLSLTGFSDAELEKILGAAYADEPPDEFATPDETTDTTCPKCGYQWNAPK